MIDAKSLQNLTKERLEKLGYRYLERNKLTHKIKNFVPYTTFKHKRKKSAAKNLLYKSLDDLSMIKLHDVGSYESCNNSNDIIISIPILSILEMKKFPKQYLQAEKLLMLNPGIEVISTNYQSMKICFGEECSYDTEELLDILVRYTKVKNPTSMFAYTYRESIVLPKSWHRIDDDTAPNFYHVQHEVYRLDLLASSEWKLADQCICSSYPSQVVIPQSAYAKGKLKLWSEFHTNGCFPIVTWRNHTNGNILLRSGTSAAIRGSCDSRNIVDEEIMNSICSASSSKSTKQRDLYIFTDRYTSIGGYSNSATLKKGESSTLKRSTSFYYPHCKLVHFDNLPAVNASHTSALKLLNVLTKSDDIHYLSSIEDTGWLKEISTLLDYALCIMTSLNKNNASVLVSLGNGIERVAQLSSLVQLLIDPYYRTLDGFQVLIQKEWLSIKHSFYKRNLLDFSSEEELSPLFLQFLDCVYQISLQFPTAFQFSNDFLEFLAIHSYSGRFDNFTDIKFGKEGISIWSYINVYSVVQDNFYNFNYDATNNRGVLQIHSSIVHLEIWSWFNRYRREESLFISQMFSVMEMEKLQVEFKNLLSLHTSLLNKFSNADEYSTDTSFNSHSVTSSESCSVYTSSSNDTTSSSGDSVFGDLKPKWRSVEDLISTRGQSYSSIKTLTLTPDIQRKDFFTKHVKSKSLHSIKTLTGGIEKTPSFSNKLFESSFDDINCIKIGSSTFYKDNNMMDLGADNVSFDESMPLKTIDTSFVNGNSAELGANEFPQIKTITGEYMKETLSGDSSKETINSHKETTLGDSQKDKINKDFLKEAITKGSLKEKITVDSQKEAITRDSLKETVTGDSLKKEICNNKKVDDLAQDSLGENIFENDDTTSDDSEYDIIENTEISLRRTSNHNTSKYDTVPPEKDTAPTAIQLLKGLRDSTKLNATNHSVKYINLKDYLIAKGIDVNGIEDIMISKSTCCGFLVKQGNRYKSWKRRWFVIDLSKKNVSYFENQNSIEPKGVINYMSIRSVTPDKNQKKNQYLFHVETYERIYPIKATSEKLMNIWTYCFTVPLANIAT